MTSLSRFAAIASAFILMLITVSSCKSTAHGAGEDIEKMGEKIQEKTN